MRIKTGRGAALFTCVIALVVMAGGDVRADVPVEIRTWADLHNIRITDKEHNDYIGGLAGHYILMNDLGEDTDGYGAYASASANDDKGWEPIGSQAEPFTGTFDGGGFTISGLVIERGDEFYVGLFGHIGGGTVKNTVLLNVDITGLLFTGGLVGMNDGTVENSSAEGSVKGNIASGGIAGHNKGTITTSSSSGTITALSSAGQVAGTALYSLNLAGGKNVQNVEILHGISFAIVGGLVGENGGMVENSYSTGSVEGSISVGGLVGYNGGAIESSYSTGSVKGNTYVGGLVGGWGGGGGVIENSFWDMESSGVDTSDGGTGKTTAGMKNIDTFIDTETEGLEEAWDFDSIWDIDGTETINHGYPFLRWSVLVDNGNGDDASPPKRGRPSPSPEPGPEGPNPPEGFSSHPVNGFRPSNRVQWGPGGSEGAAQYNLYVSTGGGEGLAASQETGDLKFWLLGEFDAQTFEYTHTGLTRSVKYYYALTSICAEGRESAMTSEVMWAVAGTDEFGVLPAIQWSPERAIGAPEADESSGCFIATAAYGSGMTSEVMSLRAFRDGLLLSNGAGRRLVDAYYTASPVFAEAIEGNSALKRIARLHLAPVVKAAGWMFN